MMLNIACFLILIDVAIVVTKKRSLLPAGICAQAVIVSIGSFIGGMGFGPIAVILIIKAFVIPFLLYFIMEKTNGFVQEPAVIKRSMMLLLIFGMFLTAWLFARKLNAGHFVIAAVFTMLTGILFIVSKRTIVSQFVGFIILQNGIFTVTSFYLPKFSFSIEILLTFDVLLTVCIMVYAIKLMHENCGSIDIKTFSSLRG
jgi:hydrogenase-4 component E